MRNTILIIDDCIQLLENTAELLNLAGYTTVVSHTGEEGLAQAKRVKPDLILCDISMRGMNGYEVLNAIGTVPELLKTPFVFFTAKAEKSEIRKGMDLGADDYLVKPFTGEELLASVAAGIKKSHKRRIREAENDPEISISQVFNSGKAEDFFADCNTIRLFRKKSLIYEEGDPSKYLYFLRSGRVKAYKTNEFGQEYITGILKKGDFFGCVALLSETEQQESVMALEDCEIAQVNKDEVYKLLCQNNALLYFLGLVSQKLSGAENRLVKLAYNSARKRVAEALVFVSEKYESEVAPAEFPFSRGNISALAGLTPESVSRNLADFKSKGLIAVSRGRIRVLDIQKLRNIKN